MIGCLRTRVRKQPIIALYFESETEIKFYNLDALSQMTHAYHMVSHVRKTSNFNASIHCYAFRKMTRRSAPGAMPMCEKKLVFLNTF